MMSNLLDRFLRYVQIDTESDENSETCPSSAKQWNLARLLADELHQIGMQEVSLDANGYVMATLPAHPDYTDVATLGFVAHYDTSPQFTGADVRPQVIEAYQGQDIVLDPATNLRLSPTDFPMLLRYLGQTLITTSGNSLLGADDKAGIAEIITAMHHLVQHPELPHGRLRVCFTPDEEIGRGADRFDVAAFGARYAYTLDGGPEGELEFENFNAAGATLHFQGRSVHPGSAKGLLLNAQQLAFEFHQLLPVEQRPEFTDGYEGFYMLTRIQGEIDQCTAHYLVRDHDRPRFEARKLFLQQACTFLEQKYGAGCVRLDLRDQYYNMRQQIEPVFFVVEQAEAAMRELGIEPVVRPIRGGTDGARLSYMGLPTPNLFTGGHNYHGRYEYAVLETMQKATQLIVKIAERYATHRIV